MAMIQLTWKQIKNLGLEQKVMEWNGWDSERIRWRGGISDDEVVEFDDEFEKVEENIKSDSVTFVVKFNYKQILTKEQKSEIERRFGDLIYDAWDKGNIDPLFVDSTNYEMSGIVEDEDGNM